MQVSVDPEKCQGHLRCILYAPDVFEVDHFGHSTARLAVVPAELEDSTRRAAANCPESAISIVD